MVEFPANTPSGTIFDPTPTQNRPPMEVLDTRHFEVFGFLVLRHFFDPRWIAEEIDQVMRKGRRSSFELARNEEICFQYVPMMTAETPGSLWLLDRAEAVAATLLGGPVLPIRAKGVRYWGNTPGTPIPIFRLRASASWPTSNLCEKTVVRCASYPAPIARSSPTRSAPSEPSARPPRSCRLTSWRPNPVM